MRKALLLFFAIFPAGILSASFFSTSLALAAENVIVADPRANVVLIAVAKVTVPESLPGLCQVRGTINDVLDGKGFRKGQEVLLPVPCGSQGLRPLDPAAREAHLLDPQVLRMSRQGIAHLTNDATLIWGATPKQYGTFGRVSGYRVYDGVILPLRQASR